MSQDKRDYDFLTRLVDLLDEDFTLSVRDIVRALEIADDPGVSRDVVERLGSALKYEAQSLADDYSDMLGY